MIVFLPRLRRVSDADTRKQETNLRRTETVDNRPLNLSTATRIDSSIDAVVTFLAGDDIEVSTPVDKYAELTIFGSDPRFIEIMIEDDENGYVEIVRGEVCTLEELPDLIVKYAALRDALAAVPGIEVRTLIQTMDAEEDGKTDESIHVTAIFRKNTIAEIGQDGRIARIAGLYDMATGGDIVF